MKLWLAGAALGLVMTAGAAGQGCSQCREQVGQTAARTQQAYRRGIGVLMLGVGCVAGAMVWW